MSKRHRNWYHKKSGKGRTRLEVKVLIKNLINKCTDLSAFMNHKSTMVEYVRILGMITALKWVINWCDLDDNFNEQEYKDVKAKNSRGASKTIRGVSEGVAVPGEPQE